MVFSDTSRLAILEKDTESALLYLNFGAERGDIVSQA